MWYNKKDHEKEKLDANLSNIKDEIKKDKIIAVLTSCTSWKQLMLAHTWVCKIVKNKGLTDEYFTTCVRLNNLKRFS